MRTVAPHPRALGILQLTPRLLFQLLLENYCTSHRHAQRMHTIAVELGSPAHALASERRQEGRHRRFVEVGERLVGGSEMTIPGLTMAPVLEKLNEACWRLVRHKSLVNEETMLLCDASDRAKAIVRKSLSYHQAIECGDKERLPALEKETKRLQSCLRTFGKSALKAIELFADDANVLYYLLRRRDVLDAALPTVRRRPAASSFLLDRFQGSPEELQKHLHQRYRRRGFEELVPKIDQHIESLASEQGCPPPSSYTLN